MNCSEIIIAHLKAIGADGLYNASCDECGCGCGIDDLAPCGECFDFCVPAKEINGPEGIVYVPLEAGKDNIFHISPFRNDPFHVVTGVFAELWPNAPLPFIQWIDPGVLHVNDGDLWGCISFDDNTDEALITIDASIQVCGALEVLAHELAHAAVHDLGLKESDDHGPHWSECFEKINSVFNERQLTALAAIPQ